MGLSRIDMLWNSEEWKNLNGFNELDDSLKAFIKCHLIGVIEKEDRQDIREKEKEWSRQNVGSVTPKQVAWLKDFGTPMELINTLSTYKAGKMIESLNAFKDIPVSERYNHLAEKGGIE